MPGRRRSIVVTFACQRERWFPIEQNATLGVNLMVEYAAAADAR